MKKQNLIELLICVIAVLAIAAFSECGENYIKQKIEIKNERTR